MFRVNASTLILVESVSGSCFVDFYHERLHIIQFEIRLTFGAGVDRGENGRVVEVDVTIGTIFFVCGDPGFVPFSSANIALMFCHPGLSFSCSFSDVGVVGFRFTIAIEFVDELSWREFSLIFAA